MRFPLLWARNLELIYQRGPEAVRAVRGVSLEVEPGQVLVIAGRSGSGKTSLLNLLAGLERPTSGTVLFEGQDLSALGEGELGQLRRHKMGFLFQSFGLLPLLSAYENVELPLHLAGASRQERRERALACLEQVGLSPRLRHRPYELSGGEQQRLALARALANRPRLILADEPTGQLDSATGQAIASLLLETAAGEGVAIVIASNDPVLLQGASLVKEMVDGAFRE